MVEHTKTDLGEIKIHRNVIASIALEATQQIPGVLKIGETLRTRFFELFGQKDNSNIRIDVDKNNETTVTIPIVVSYGYNIPEIASKIQENVKLAIERAVNADITEVNVIIQEIEKVPKQEGGAV